MGKQKHYPDIRMTKKDYRDVTKFLLLKGLNLVQIRLELKEVFGDDAPSIHAIKDWIIEITGSEVAGYRKVVYVLSNE